MRAAIQVFKLSFWKPLLQPSHNKGLKQNMNQLSIIYLKNGKLDKLIDRKRRNYFSVSVQMWMHAILIKLREARWKQCIVEYKLPIA